LNWIIDIFSSKSDQARLVAILVSALVAILVVLLNQWFLSRRSKRELLIEKVEDLFSASNEYIAACRELMRSLSEPNLNSSDKPYEYPKGSLIKLNDSITKMQMICGLYFRSEKFSPESLHISNMPIFDIAYKVKTLQEGEGHIKSEQSREHIIKSRDKLDKLCKKLMKKYGH
jgi:hypothetical protein